MKRETAEKIAKWWARQLQRGGTNMNDNGVLGAIASLFGSEVQANARNKNSPDKITRFMQALTDHLEKEDDDLCFIETDYAPKGILREVCEQTGIDGSAFPWKTRMLCHHNQITVNGALIE